MYLSLFLPGVHVMHELAMMCTIHMVMQYKSMELTGFFPRSQGASEGRQQPRKHAAGMQEWDGEPNGRQAGEQFVVGRQAFGWYVGRQRTAGLVRRSCLQSGHSGKRRDGKAGRQAGGRAGRRLECRRAEGRHAIRQVPGGRQWKNYLFLFKQLGHLQESGILTNVNILFHFSIVTICHKMRFWVWDVTFRDELLRMISHKTQGSWKYFRARIT